MNIKKYLIFLYMSVMILLFAEPSIKKELTFSEALEIALLQSSEYRNAQTAYEKAKLQLQSSELISQTVIQLNCQYAYSNVTSQLQQVKDPLDVSISVGVPVLSTLVFNSSYNITGAVTFGAVFTPLKVSTETLQAEIQLAKINKYLQSIQISICKTLAGYYAGVQTAYWSYRYAQLAEQSAKLNKDAAEIEYKNGNLSYYDYTTMQSNYFTAQQTMLKNYTDYMTALYNLSLYLNMDVESIAVSDDIPQVFEKIASYTEDAIKQAIPFETFVLLQKDYYELSLDYQYRKSIIKTVLPDLSLQGTVSYNTQNNAIGVTVGGSIKLGTGVITQNAYKIQILELEQTEANLNDLYSKYKNNYNMIVRQVFQYSILYQGALLQYKKAVQNYHNTKDFYNSSMVGIRELVQAELAMVNARLQLEQYWWQILSRLADLGLLSNREIANF